MNILAMLLPGYLFATTVPLHSLKKASQVVSASTAASAQVGSTKAKASKKQSGTADSDSASLKSTTTAQEEYNNLFKDKRVSTSKGDFMTLHKVDDEIYFELPVKYLKKEILFGSTIGTVSEPDILTVGMKYNAPILFFFDIQGKNIMMNRLNTTAYSSTSGSHVQEVLQNSFRSPVLTSFPIKAYTPDSSAVVFSVKSLVGQDNSLNPIIPKQVDFYTINASPLGNLSSVRAIKSFEDNVSVRTELSYSVSVSLMGMLQVVKDMPFTTEVVHTFKLMGDQQMSPRLADARVGFSAIRKLSLFGRKEGIDYAYFIHRRRLEPKDKASYLAGKLVEPTTPIVYFLDPAFPESWKESIRNGVLSWNAAFEKIGFKNAIQVRDFPTDQPDFDPDNMKYSCIRYIPSRSGSYLGTSWTDPRTGEIINATILIHNNIQESLHEWRFVQTANADPSVRRNTLSPEAFAESLQAAVAHATGRTLGLEVNLAGSSSIPVESLRNGTFTQQNGLSHSVMDNLSFNYVAQPSDDGVQFVPYKLGAYDYYAIEYGYKYLTEPSPEEEYRTELEKFVDTQSQNPIYRYSPPQQKIVDPSALNNDLGDDPILAATYGMKNLKGVVEHLPIWITDDEDSRIKTRLYLQAAQQNYALYKNVVYLLGGVYLNNSKESSPIPRYRVVDKAKQQEALHWAVNTIINFREQSNLQLERKGFIEVSFFDQLVEYLVAELFNRNQYVLKAWCLDKNAYSQAEFFEDLFTAIYAHPPKGKKLENNQMFMQRYFVDAALATIGGKPQNSAGQLPNTSASIQLTKVLLEGSSATALSGMNNINSFGTPNKPLTPTVYSDAEDNTSGLYLQYIAKLKPIAEKGLKKAKEPELKSHYNYILLKVNKILDENAK